MDLFFGCRTFSADHGRLLTKCGQRASTAVHYQLAENHGYTAIADVDIMDSDGSMTLKVVEGDNLTENYVGVHFADYDYYVILSHFKSHAMAGYGGAIKNISTGIASAEGKSHIYTGGKGGCICWMCYIGNLFIFGTISVFSLNRFLDTGYLEW